MFKFIHTADIHLDSPLHKLDAYEGAPVEEFRGATRRAFDNLVDLALSEEVHFVVVAGDLYDGDWKDYNTGLYLVRRMGRLREAGIPVFIASGNHDATGRIGKNLRFPENVRVFPETKPFTYEIPHLKVALHGQSFPSPAVRSNLSLGYPDAWKGYFNLGVLHTSATGREGHEPYAPCSPEDLAGKGYDYWALGHVHQYEMLSKDPPIVFSGNIQGRHIRETGAKGCVLAAVDDHGVVRSVFRSLDVVRWVMLRVDAAGAESGYDLIEQFSRGLDRMLAENGNMPIAARVLIRGESKATDVIFSEPERWTNQVRAVALDAGGGRVWIEKVDFDIHAPPSAAVLSPGDGAMAELLRLFEELQTDPVARRELVSELAELDKRLPRELREGSESIRMDDEKWIAGLLARAKPMLVKRLLGKAAER
jgi:DNA repair protein SbcD/Mre11